MLVYQSQTVQNEKGQPECKARRACWGGELLLMEKRGDYRECFDPRYTCLSLLLFAGYLWLLVQTKEEHLKDLTRERNKYSDHWKCPMTELWLPFLSYKSLLTLSMPPPPFWHSIFSLRSDSAISSLLTSQREMRKSERWVENMQLYDIEYVLRMANCKLTLDNFQGSLKMSDSKTMTITPPPPPWWGNATSCLNEHQIVSLNDELKVPAKGLNC